MGMGRREENGLLYPDNMVFCGESEKDLRAKVGHFDEVCRRRGLKVSAGKSKVMVLGGEEGLECEACIDGIGLEYVSEFKYLGCFWTNQVQIRQSVGGRWQV